MHDKYRHNFDDQIHIRRGKTHYLVVLQPQQDNDPYLASLWLPYDVDSGSLELIDSRAFDDLGDAQAWCDQRDAEHLIELYDEIEEYLTALA